MFILHKWFHEEFLLLLDRNFPRVNFRLRFCNSSLHFPELCLNKFEIRSNLRVFLFSTLYNIRTLSRFANKSEIFRFPFSVVIFAVGEIFIPAEKIKLNSLVHVIYTREKRNNLRIFTKQFQPTSGRKIRMLQPPLEMQCSLYIKKSVTAQIKF